MKEYRVQFRLSENEYQDLQAHLEQSGMTASTYFRSLLQNTNMQVVNHDREIMVHVCRIYDYWNAADMDDVLLDSAREELNNICRLLKP